jgi:hypothetical protein
MLSWRFWNFLYGSYPIHSLFEHVMHPGKRKWFANLALGIESMLIILLPIGLFLFAFPGGSTLLGAIQIANFCNAIQRERDGSRLDLLYLTSLGILGTNWLICLMNQRLKFLSVLYVVLAIAVLSIQAFNVVISLFLPDGVILLSGSLPYFILWCVLVADHIQSLVLAPLIALRFCSGDYDHKQILWRSLGWFLLSQAVVYLSTVFVISFAWQQPIFILLVLVSFCVLREIVIMQIWRSLNVSGEGIRWLERKEKA